MGDVKHYILLIQIYVVQICIINVYMETTVGQQ